MTGPKSRVRDLGSALTFPTRPPSRRGPDPLSRPHKAARTAPRANMAAIGGAMRQLDPLALAGEDNGMLAHDVAAAQPWRSRCHPCAVDRWRRPRAYLVVKQREVAALGPPPRRA